MGRRVTRNELAEEWGVSRSRIDNMVHKDQLAFGADRKIDIDEANKVRDAFDPARVEQARNAAISKGKKDKQNTDTSEASTNPKLYDARTMEAVARAKLAQLKVQEVMGAVVPRHKAKETAQAAARVMVARLMALPGRLAPMLAHETTPVKCRELIEKEVKQLIVELQEKLAEI